MQNRTSNIYLPILPLKESHIFPKMIIPILVGQRKTMAAIQDSTVNYDGKIICLVEKNVTPNKDYPHPDDLYDIGYICKIHQIIKMPESKIRVLLCSEKKIKINQIDINNRYLMGAGFIMDEIFNDTKEELILKEKLLHECVCLFKLIKSPKSESINKIKTISIPIDLIYYIICSIDLNIEEIQKIIALTTFYDMAKYLINVIKEKIGLINLHRSIDNKVYDKISKMQRDHFLSEKLKAIHQELGNTSDAQSEIMFFKEKIKKLNLSAEAKKKTEEEFKKLSRISVHSPEYFVCYNYLSWVLDIPWDKPKIKSIDIDKAENILNKDHYGLDKIKERIIEYLAVMQFNVESKAQILCFVGPPGVGKTSLGKSIAKALGREFIRISVGGVTDESEIRGHRKTYIGAMPGVIIQSLKKAGTTNTLIMIDEIDKLGSDYKGDPSSALLEVLDPEQNNSFRDHYLDFGYDLSKVFFITTANYLSTIPSALKDRMEIIRLSSYTEHEKTFIAKDYLIPKIKKEFDTNKKLSINIPDDTIKSIIRKYTAEAGVRELERNINAIFRKSIKKHLKKEIKKSVTINDKILKDYLGTPIFSDKDLIRKDAVGVGYGLAWTSIGGEILPIEVLKFSGEGRFNMTGNIGKVMQESAKAAMSLIRTNHKKWGIKKEVFKKYDLHIHIPEGAVPKDGPSAGIVLVLAMISALSERPFDHTYALTGEISLTGRILPIGGLTEKIIAAQRNGFKNVILPKNNKKDFDDIKPEAKENMNFIFEDNIDNVVKLVLK